jgi:hypothetical protein
MAREVWTFHLAMILNMEKEGMVDNMKIIQNNKYISLCEGCIFGKRHKQPHLKNDKTSTTKKPNKFYHSYVCGPISIISLGGAK